MNSFMMSQPVSKPPLSTQSICRTDETTNRDEGDTHVVKLLTLRPEQTQRLLASGFAACDMTWSSNISLSSRFLGYISLLLSLSNIILPLTSMQTLDHHV